MKITLNDYRPTILGECKVGDVVRLIDFADVPRIVTQLCSACAPKNSKASIAVTDIDGFQSIWEPTIRVEYLGRLQVE